MMRVTVDVNGLPIAAITIVNRGPQTPDGRGWRRYEWQCRRPDEAPLTGSVRHRREDGWAPLVERVMREIEARS